MVRLPTNILLLVAVASAAHLGLAPAATGYIYRSDNNGPASLIQLGAHNYQPLYPPLDQALNLAQPLVIPQPYNLGHELTLAQPIAEPLKPVDVYEIGPAPLPYVVEKPIILEDTESDEDSDESSDEYLDSDDDVSHGHGYEKGDGSNYNEEHHAANGEKSSKGYKSQDHHAKGESGHYNNEHSEGHSSEEEGEKGAHHDEADAHGKHHESGKSYKGGDHGHKKYASKGEDVTGYHKIFHKDEYKKDHDFYDVADNSGNFKKHGYAKNHHGSENGGHKEGESHDSGYDKAEHGKAGFHSKGHVDADHVEHSAEEGNESTYNHHEDHGKKGGNAHEKEYAYDDDDDDEDY